MMKINLNQQKNHLMPDRSFLNEKILIIKNSSRYSKRYDEILKNPFHYYDFEKFYMLR